jgi:flagellar biosynthesis/type III secretory pathway protein FliH
MSRQELYRIASQNGYRDGLRLGRQDRARNRQSDFDNHREYRDAVNGYRNEYRAREYYQQAYREGFRSGYEDGYRRNNPGRRWPF